MEVKTTAEKLIIDAVMALKPSLRLRVLDFTAVDDILAAAVRREPRILPFIKFVSSTIATLTTGEKEITFRFAYSVGGEAPSSIHEVDVDRGDWDISSLYRPVEPAERFIVSDDPRRTTGNITSDLERLTARYENLHGCRQSISSLEGIPYTVIKLQYSRHFPQERFLRLRSEAELEARRVWKKILSNARVSESVRPFLAYSYINREFEYDHAFLARFKAPGYDPEKDPPYAFVSYGPLITGKGVCAGLAWAFKRMMDVSGIPCITIGGAFRSDPGTGHMWNMVKLDNGCWYHVDTGVNISSDGFSVSGFLKNDAEFSEDYIWKRCDAFPANGPGNMIDFYREHFDSNRTAYVRAGINERYAFPEFTV